jgi:hypothetical protein
MRTPGVPIVTVVGRTANRRLRGRRQQTFSEYRTTCPSVQRELNSVLLLSFPKVWTLPHFQAIYSHQFCPPFVSCTADIAVSAASAKLYQSQSLPFLPHASEMLDTAGTTHHRDTPHVEWQVHKMEWKPLYHQRTKTKNRYLLYRRTLVTEKHVMTVMVNDDDDDDDDDDWVDSWTPVIQ